MKPIQPRLPSNVIDLHNWWARSKNARTYGPAKLREIALEADDHNSSYDENDLPVEMLKDMVSKPVRP